MKIPSLEQLRKDFLQEAQNAPRLFKDLAKVEKYIAESYKTRALIELIQNADDAQASLFGIHSFEDGFIVGNDGREFTIEDVEALCRSGSSNKVRGGNTIGYRGIGFKSVVNLAKEVYVFSGRFHFYFDKGITQQVLLTDADVPLIRVPHLLENENEALCHKVNEFKSNYGYKSVFLFKKILEEISFVELREFDRSSLLFLNNIQMVQIDFKFIHREIVVEHKNLNERNVISLAEGNSIDKWQVEAEYTNKVDRVAYKILGEEIVPALPAESVIHSFTPTYEFSGALIKINGDFTTDPSRKTIDLDEQSKKSFDNVVSLIANSITSILNDDINRNGFFKPFVNVQLAETSKFKLLLFKGLEAKLSSFSNLRIKPDWLNYEDYENICFQGIRAVSKQQITAYPELFSFLELISIKTLNLDEIINRINDVRLTIHGAAEILCKIIKQNRYDLNNEKVEYFKELKIFPVNQNFISASKLNSIDEVLSQFIEHLRSICDSDDCSYFFRKLGIKQNNETSAAKLTESRQSSTISVPTSMNNTFRTEPAIKKWRSAEQNAAEYLKSLNTVLSVKDVTQANLGYDLEVLLTSGKRLYIEVKSVSSFSEPFKISNNEYSSAHSYGLSYCIAIVINEEPFQIRFISNPLNRLSFEKKCERWSWFCDQYAMELQDVNAII